MQLVNRQSYASLKGTLARKSYVVDLDDKMMVLVALMVAPF